jgi:signal transduction histidine kinase
VEKLVDAHRRVLASASHELRSPLARVRLALEIVSDRTQPDADPLLAEAVRDVEALDATVGDLLRLGRLQATEALASPDDVDLRALVAELAPLDPPTAGAHGSAAPSVRGDAALLRVCVRNLVENARRHGGEPVTARVDAAGFSILDRGPGVPDPLRERIFEPFFRPEGHAEGRDGGVGLGLHLCREIARVHGARIACLPREGGGSEFRVTFSG